MLSCDLFWHCQALAYEGALIKVIKSNKNTVH
jgi:hypothetical protein